MEEHGGHIDVESEMGCGTTFNIVVPTEPVETEERD
jgi:signal transduction histidine kinase